MDAVEVPSGSPLAEALQNVIQPKLAEQGWSSGGGDDSALSEYIVLMLSNPKTQEQVANELASDLLSLQPGDESAVEFSRWLFEQIHALNVQLNGGPAPGQQMNTSGAPTDGNTEMGEASMDATMTDGSDGQISGVPTGPKSMRNGQGNPRGRDRRMLGQMRNAMDRSGEQSLHHIKGAAGAGRIQRNREPPRGPRGGMANRMQNMMGRGPGVNPQMMNGVSPTQQMALFKMLEEQSRMMAQILGPNGQANQPAINPAFFGNQQAGKSLFERVDRRKQNGHYKKQQNSNGDDMETDGAGEDGEKDQSQIPCKFQLSCTSPTCPYAHQSPAAPPGVTIDVTDKCSYGPACQNKKCVASHPSPSQRRQHLGSTVDCKFYPNCTNPSCPFRHPTTPPCRNGADCPTKDSGCKFSHSTIACRYNPCLNPRCTYTHVEGQKRGNFTDKVWTAEGFDRESAQADEKNHVSERKFTVGDEEELILPAKQEGEAVKTEKMTEAPQADAIV
ncbi:hypothetical protein MBLNU457_2322t1 [Dothideomycetes sp. NU457]